MNATTSVVAGRAHARRKADAAFKISFARRNSLTSRSSSPNRERSSVLSPGGAARPCRGAHRAPLGASLTSWAQMTARA